MHDYYRIPPQQRLRGWRGTPLGTVRRRPSAFNSRYVVRHALIAGIQTSYQIHRVQVIHRSPEKAYDSVHR